MEAIEEELAELQELCRQHQLEQKVPRPFTWNRSPNYIQSALSTVRLVVKCLTLTILVSFLIISFLMNTHLQKWALSYSQELIYPVMRQVRLLSLPLIPTSNDHLRSLHLEECLVQNPFFASFPADCWPCRYVIAVPDLTNNVIMTRDYVSTHRPFVFRDAYYSTIDLNVISSMIQVNSDNLHFGTASLTSNLNFNLKVSNLIELLNKTAIKRPYLQLSWRLHRVESVRVLRKVFLRPPFVPKNTEVSLEKHLLFDGLNSSSYPMPSTQFAHVWLVQLFGSRLFTFDPKITCKSQCRPLSVLLRPGDILYYNWLLWTVYSAPTNQISEPSQSNVALTYVSSFY